MKIRRESDMDKIVIKFLRHSRTGRPSCRNIVPQMAFQKAKFDVVGFSTEDGIFHIVESKMDIHPKAIGYAFGQILVYKSILSGKGYQFLDQFYKRSRLSLSIINKVLSERKLRVCFYVALRDRAFRDYDLIKLIKQSIPSVGIIRIRDDGVGRHYLRKPGGEKNVEICKSQVMDIPVIKKYSITEFLNEIEDRVRKKLPHKFMNVKTNEISDKSWGKYKQFWYHRHYIHFEVWLRAIIEIGLHIEGFKKKSIKLYNYLKRQEKNIRRKLPDIKFLPKFGKNWCKIYQEVHKEELTEELVEKVSKKLVRFIKVLQPLLIEFEH